MARIALLFAFLLIGATPSPRHHHHAYKAKTVAKEQHASPSPIATPSYQSGSNAAATESRHYTYNYNYPALKSESPPVWFQVLTTIILLMFTCGLWVTSIWQWRAIKEQADLARTALIDLETPRVSISKITAFVRQSDETPYPRPWFSFGFRNDGRSVAELTSVCGIARILSNLPFPVDYSGGTVDKSGFFISPGSDTDEVKWRAVCTENIRGPEGFQPILNETASLVVFGYVRYLDVFGQKWISGFAWRWNPRDGGVYLAGGSNYNYAKKDE